MTGLTNNSLSPSFRAFSAFEFLLGAFIVIGHNVFQILPNEVPILFVLGLVSVRVRDHTRRAGILRERPRRAATAAVAHGRDELEGRSVSLMRRNARRLRSVHWNVRWWPRCA